MAKKSSIEKNKRRERLVKKFAGKREALKKIANDTSLPMEEQFAARLKLAELPRNSARVRIRLRCELTGRPRGNYRKFKLCRIALRDLASAGQILKACGVDTKTVKTVNVLEDEGIRQGIKTYSSWPTIPQLYVKGEFVGGSDIMMEMYESGELQQVINGQA